MKKDRKINIKAIMLGFITSFIGATITVVIASFIYFIIYDLTHTHIGPPLTFEQRQIAGAYAAQKPDVTLIIIIIILFCFNLLGGWITGKIAKNSEIINSAIMGFIFLLISAIQIGPDYSPLWRDLSELIPIIPGAILGGYIAYKKRKTSNNSLQMT